MNLPTFVYSRNIVSAASGFDIESCDPEKARRVEYGFSPRQAPEDGLVRGPCLPHLRVWPRCLGSAPSRKSQDHSDNTLGRARDDGSALADVEILGRQVVAAQHLGTAAQLFAGQPSVSPGACLGPADGRAVDGGFGRVLDSAIPAREDARQRP